MIEKIWLVTQESNVDGEIMFNAIPCISEETAKKVMEQEKNTILSESIHYKKYDKDDFKVEDDDVHSLFRTCTMTTTSTLLSKRNKFSINYGKDSTYRCYHQ